MRHPRRVAARVGLAVFVLTALIVGFGPARALISDPVRLRQSIAAGGALAPLLLIVFQGAQVMWAPVPGTPFALVSGYLFGTWFGTLYSFAGIMLGTAGAIALSRRFGERALHVFVGGKVAGKLSSFSRERSLLFYFLLLFLPNPLGDGTNYLMGLTRHNFATMMLVSGAARLPGLVLTVYVGDVATGFTARTWLVIAGAALVGGALYWRYAKRVNVFLTRVLSR